MFLVVLLLGQAAAELANIEMVSVRVSLRSTVRPTAQQHLAPGTLHVPSKMLFERPRISRVCMRGRLGVPVVVQSKRCRPRSRGVLLLHIVSRIGGVAFLNCNDHSISFFSPRRGRVAGRPCARLRSMF